MTFLVTMDERDFWLKLEYRICREFSGMRDGRLRDLWCDGIIPRKYSLTEHPPFIAGSAWICRGSHQAEWEFTLHLPRRVKSREEIDWASLLPPDNVTSWLSLDEQRRAVRIEPSLAESDVI